MNNRKYSIYCLSAMAGVAAMCSYPIYMGIKVVARMMTTGAIPYKEYPKYVIPYTPIGLSLIVGVLLIPLLQKIFKKLDMIAGSIVALAVFFVTELLMESKVLVEADTFVVLGSWQMSLCYVPPEEYRTRTWEAVDILLGGYNPYFKLHFYLISVVIIIAFMNFLYGFARMILTGNYKRRKALILQAVTAVLFLAMCIWACFTAFYRTGELTVKPVSAVLMGTFFALLGVTAGIFSASLAIGKKRLFSTIIPSVTSVLVTVLMYIGEMILLNGHLYRFGRGLLFRGLQKMVLAPIDIIIILAAGAITALTCLLINKKSKD
jgi:hypothetical protein